jgi:hypothetical protein
MRTSMFCLRAGARASTSFSAPVARRMLLCLLLAPALSDLGCGDGPETQLGMNPALGADASVVTAAPSLTPDASATNPAPSLGAGDSGANTGTSAIASQDAGSTIMRVDAGIGLDAGLGSDSSVQGDAGGSASSDAASTPEGGSASGIKPGCLKKPSQVVALGDSYVGAPVVLIPKVEALAVMGGGLMSGQHYRDYGAPGTTLGSPTTPGSIPPQWDAAKRADMDIKVVIMDGGGNDILGSIDSILGGCLDPGSTKNMTCTNIIQGCMGMVRKMAMDMKAVGVQDVIYFLYPHVPAGGDEILDYSVDEARKMAPEVSTDTFRMHLVDTRPPFMGHAEYFDIDPIHANEAGAQQIAKLVWQTMKDKCIAQPASSGCCTP